MMHGTLMALMHKTRMERMRVLCQMHSTLMGSHEHRKKGKKKGEEDS